MEPEGQGTVHVFGRAVPREAERKFLLIAGAAGILGLLLIVFKNRAAAAAGSSPVSGPPSATGAPGSGSSASGSGDGSTSPPTAAPLPTSLHFSFTESTSPSIEVEKSGGNSVSGGFSFGPFKIGGGGGSSSSRHVKEDVSNVFSTDVTITNGSQSEIDSLLAAIKGLAGTQEERAAQAQQEINQAYTFVEPGHTISGVIAEEASQQRLLDAQNQAKIDKITGGGHRIVNRPGGANSPVLLGGHA